MPPPSLGPDPGCTGQTSSHPRASQHHPDSKKEIPFLPSTARETSSDTIYGHSSHRRVPGKRLTEHTPASRLAGAVGRHLGKNPGLREQSGDRSMLGGRCAQVWEHRLTERQKESSRFPAGAARHGADKQTTRAMNQSLRLIQRSPSQGSEQGTRTTAAFIIQEHAVTHGKHERLWLSQLLPSPHLTAAVGYFSY